jgi:hypothetical protein
MSSSRHVILWLWQVCASKISLFSKDFRVEEGDEGVGDAKVKEGKIEVSPTMRLLIFTVAVVTEVRERERPSMSFKVTKGDVTKGMSKMRSVCLHGASG